MQVTVNRRVETWTPHSRYSPGAETVSLAQRRLSGTMSGIQHGANDAGVSVTTTQRSHFKFKRSELQRCETFMGSNKGACNHD